MKKPSSSATKECRRKFVLFPHSKEEEKTFLSFFSRSHSFFSFRLELDVLRENFLNKQKLSF